MHKFKSGDKVKYVNWFNGFSGPDGLTYDGTMLGDILTIEDCDGYDRYSFKEFTNGDHHSRVEECFELT